MSAADKVIADLDTLDERLSLTRPVCCLCGHRIWRLNFVTVESPAFTPRHAHQECADSVGGVGALATRVWRSIVASATGESETPAPAPARIRGAFL